MTTCDREEKGVLAALDSAMLRAIRGAFWLPLVYLPGRIRRSFPTMVRLLRVFALFAAWIGIVFGPLALLDEVREPVVAAAILAWTLLALVGSAVGVMRLRKTAHASRGAEKPASLAEAFV